MKLGLLTASLNENGGGVQVAVRQLGAALNKIIDVRIYGGSGEGREPGFRVFPATPPQAFGYLPGLSRALEADRLDVLHTHGLWMYPSVACTRWSKPFCHTGDFAARHAGRMGALELRLEEEGVRLAIRRSQPPRSGMPPRAEHFGSRLHPSLWARNPICVIPNGVELPEEREPRGKETDLLFLGDCAQRKVYHLFAPGLAFRRTAGTSKWLGGTRVGMSASCGDWPVQSDWEIRCASRALSSAPTKRTVQASIGIRPALVERGPSGRGVGGLVVRPAIAMTSECNLPEGFAAQAAAGMERGEDGVAEGLGRLFALSDHDLQEMGPRAGTWWNNGSPGNTLLSACARYTNGFWGPDRSQLASWQTEAETPLPSSHSLRPAGSFDLGAVWVVLFRPVRGYSTVGDGGSSGVSGPNWASGLMSIPRPPLGARLLDMGDHSCLGHMVECYSRSRKTRCLCHDLAIQLSLRATHDYRLPVCLSLPPRSLWGARHGLRPMLSSALA